MRAGLLAKPTPREPVKSGREEGERLGQKCQGKRGWLVMPRGWEVGIRRAGREKLYLPAFSKTETEAA